MVTDLYLVLITIFAWLNNCSIPNMELYKRLVASYPGHMGGGKSGQVSENLRTSPIMDKLYVVVMQRNNQTR